MRDSLAYHENLISTHQEEVAALQKKNLALEKQILQYSDLIQGILDSIEETIPEGGKL